MAALDEVRKKHCATAELPDSLKSNLGKYYTPPHLVDLIVELVSPYVKPDSVIMDLAAGCGAFLDSFLDNEWIIRDIDAEAVAFLNSIGYPQAVCDNSLMQITREKYGIAQDRQVVCLGNPPYNDISSRNKKAGKNQKSEPGFVLDAQVKSSDLGASFLRAFCLLKADVVCVLHPLAYLIKPSNFRLRLKNFTHEFHLQKGVIFSSNEFADTQKTPFPIVAALYLKDSKGMDYSDIWEFPFEIYKSTETFTLKQYETTDGYIRKYAPSRKEPVHSSIGLYMHNFRDLNSLKTVGNLSEKAIPSVTIPVEEGDLYKYAYLNCLRRYFSKDFRWGNLSPLVKSEQLDSDIYLQDACLIDTVINNQRLGCFIWNSTGKLMETLKQRMADKSPQKGSLDIYQIFRQFCTNGSCESAALTEYLKSYFQALPTRFS
ncbi:MAG: N-6 DNA methylase [Candidatus Cloacimonetes bacterium]|nr:N-6 DNA methylase [Candidatus Cloacimonadota bacterium]